MIIVIPVSVEIRCNIDNIIIVDCELFCITTVLAISLTKYDYDFRLFSNYSDFEINESIRPKYSIIQMFLATLML